MIFSYSNHAIERLKDRDLTGAIVEETISNPD
jgi:hypothetical protein